MLLALEGKLKSPSLPSIIGNLQKHFHLNVYKKSQGIKKCQTKNVKKARRLKNFRAREKYKAREKF